MARRRSRVVIIVISVVMIISVLVSGRIAFVAYGPPADDDQLAAQVRFLHTAIDEGAGPRMQRLFPEGDYFLNALTAMATTAAPGTDPGVARRLRNHLDRPESVAVFGSGMVPEHGIFQAGWALAVADDLAALTDDPADRADVERRAVIIDRALAGSTTGFLAGYPGQYWPCDTVVAASALARAAVLLDRPEWLDTVRRWRDRVALAADPQLGLLPHRVDEAGRAEEGPRGSSQAIIQAFWPAIAEALDGRPDARTWLRFRSAFVVRTAGLVGVREFPVGTAGAGDVDSGPLIFGVSASASAVTLAAAKAVGDVQLAEALSREADLLGLPTQFSGRRSYALGQLPVGDAFLAWARSRDVVGVGDPPIPGAPQPAWPIMIVAALLPAALGLGVLLNRRRRRG